VEESSDSFLAALGRELRLEMATKEDLHLLRRNLVTWLLVGMGVQTAVIGLIIGIAT
jgi:hypothetical protein